MSHPVFILSDPKSFEQVYKLHAKKLLKICVYYTGNQQESLEMVQDIFESLWNRRNELQIHSSIEHYLVRAAKLKSFRYIRDKSKRPEPAEPEQLYLCTSAHCAENNLMYTELSDQINLLVDHLPCQCRNVYTMSREQGLSNKEIASALLISEKAVEYHMTKALAFLRKNLTEYTN